MKKSPVPDEKIVIKTYLEPDEVERLEQAAVYLRDKLLIRLLFRLGCRISEALGMGIDDIDFKQRRVSIQHLKARIRMSCPECGARLGRGHKFCPGCGSRVSKAITQELEHHRFRSLPVDEDTMSMLKEYIDRGGACSKNGKELLFEISRHRAWQIIKDCAKKAGLPKLVNSESRKEHNVSPHKLRDAFAVNAVKTEWRPLQPLYHYSYSGFQCLRRIRRLF